MVLSFSPSVIENLACYVYLLIDPDTKKVFYVGKGQGNRMFQHLLEAETRNETYEKLDVIRAIKGRGKEVVCLIHRHGLTEKEAFEVESSLIDFIGLDELTNRVLGHKADNRGQMTVSEVIARYDAPPITISEPVLLIIINQLYRRGMSEPELYEVTRKSWAIAPERRKPKYALAVYNGIVRQVYLIGSWARSITDPKRREFQGEIANDLQHYVGKSVSSYLIPGARRPTRYLNC